jgi:hypothetical protein
MRLNPSIGDLYFIIGDNSSTFYNSFSYYDPNNTDNGNSYMTMDCVNTLFGTILLSKPSGNMIYASECQQVINNLLYRLQSGLSNSSTNILLTSGSSWTVPTGKTSIMVYVCGGGGGCWLWSI